MSEIKNENIEEVEEALNGEVAVPIVEEQVDKKEKTFPGRKSAQRKPFSKSGGNRGRVQKEKPEFDSKTIDIRRVTRVVSGGRRFSLSVALVAGDRNGRIGFGTGKALDTQAAIEKAFKAARKNMITLKLGKENRLSHDVKVKYKSATLWLTPNKGKGIIAGSSARTILALAGVNDVTAKFHSGTKNKMNNARATMKALSIFTR